MASLLCCIVYPPQLAKMQYTVTHTAHDPKVRFIQCGAHAIYSNRCHSNSFWCSLSKHQRYKM